MKRFALLSTASVGAILLYMPEPVDGQGLGCQILRDRMNNGTPAQRQAARAQYNRRCASPTPTPPPPPPPPPGPGPTVNARASDLRIGAQVRDQDGAVLGTIQASDATGAVVARMSVLERGRLPLAAFGRNNRGLVVSRARLFAAMVDGMSGEGPRAPASFIVFFDNDRDVVTPAAAAILDNAAAAWRQLGNASARAIVSGHTDSRASDAYNAALSQRMANNVRTYLAGHGIPDGVITTEAFGESRPLVETLDGVRELQNRRVEIRFSQGSSSPSPAAPGPAVTATAADLRIGAPVRDLQGALVGTIESLDTTGAVVNTGTARSRIPLTGFARNNLGLVISWTRAQLETAIAATRPSPGSSPPASTRLPAPLLSFTGYERYAASGRIWWRYRLDVINKSAYPAELFAPSPNLPPCGSNANSSRTWVDIFRANGSRIYGFCALGRPADLGAIWFAIEEGTDPPGQAYIEMRDRQANTVYRSNLASITAPPAANALPAPVLVFQGSERYSTAGGNFVRYRYDVSNKTAYPAAMFAAAPQLPPCGANNNSSRSWVDFFDSRGHRLYGFCALNDPQQLGQIWFAVPGGQAPPASVYIEINDRQTNRRYRSNLADTS